MVGQQAGQHTSVTEICFKGSQTKEAHVLHMTLNYITAM